MCSTIILGRFTDRLLAANYDYALGHGLIAVNLRGARKENGRPPGEPMLEWAVRHGSVTFNSFALELPAAGINERGLCIALMRHEQGCFGWDSSVKRLSPLQWIQYQLDTSSTCAEVIASLEIAQPRQEGEPLHYTVLDASGSCLLVEFLDGRPRLIEDPEVPVLTNSSHQLCLDAVEGGVAEAELENLTSLGRFDILHRFFTDRDQEHADSSLAMAALDAVRQGTAHASGPWTDGKRMTTTVWSVVFRPGDRSVEFKTHRNQSVRTIELGRLDFAPSAGYRTLDIHAGAAGEVSDLFVPYDPRDNRRLVEQSTSLIPLAPEEREQLVQLVDELYRTGVMQL